MTTNKIGETKRQRLDRSLNALWSERSTFESHWRELADFILPRRPRWNTSDVNKGERRNQRIIDSTATYAARTLRSGMMSGITSPARPWFRLGTSDPSLKENEDVQAWLYVVTERMRAVFLRSNLYRCLPVVYGDIGVFATAAMALEEDFDTVIHCKVFPIGSYGISVNDKGQVDKFGRKYTYTTRQIVAKFGGEVPGKIDWSNISDTVKESYEHNGLEDRWEVAHLIEPNQEYDPQFKESRYKKYSSTHWETGTGGRYKTDPDGKFLRQSGFDRFPVMAPRWEVNGEDTYGTDCPGMVCIGDIKQLQQGEKRGMQGIDKQMSPPLVGPSSMRRTAVSSLPGDVNYQDLQQGQQGLRPMYEVRPQIGELEQKQEQIRGRIKRGFFEDLFLMLSNSDRREITAREIEERHEEKLWALGPVLEGLNIDLLDPLIDTTFEIMYLQGLIPPPPPALQGSALKVEYVSVMAQAQKLVGLGSVERFSNFASALLQINPDVADKIDMDQLVDVYGDMTGIPPGIVKPDEVAQAARAERNKQMQQQQQMEMLSQGASAAKDLSQAGGGDSPQGPAAALGI